MERLSYFWNEVATNATPAIGAVVASGQTVAYAARGPGALGGILPSGAAQQPLSGLSGANKFNAFFFTDVVDASSKGFIEVSADGSHWVVAASGTLTASTPLILTVPLLCGYFRAKVTSGAVTQTLLIVSTSMTGA